MPRHQRNHGRRILPQLPRPIRVVGPGIQALTEALDVSEYDALDAICTIDGLVGSGSLSVRIVTGVQKGSETGWVELVAFTSASLDAVNDSNAVHGEDKLLKYIRWEVTGLNGADSIVFDISGMLRKHG